MCAIDSVPQLQKKHELFQTALKNKDHAKQHRLNEIYFRMPFSALCLVVSVFSNRFPLSKKKNRRRQRQKQRQRQRQRQRQTLEVAISLNSQSAL